MWEPAVKPCISTHTWSRPKKDTYEHVQSCELAVYLTVYRTSEAKGDGSGLRIQSEGFYMSESGLGLGGGVLRSLRLQQQFHAGHQKRTNTPEHKRGLSQGPSAGRLMMDLDSQMWTLQPGRQHRSHQDPADRTRSRFWFSGSPTLNLRLPLSLCSLLPLLHPLLVPPLLHLPQPFLDPLHSLLVSSLPGQTQGLLVELD